MSDVQTSVLVVDDSDDNRRILARRLERSGFAVTVAADGKEALAEVTRTPPDMVLLDIHMPGMDGLDVLRHIRDRHNCLDMGVIMVTADQDRDMQAEALDMGADDYIIKPVDMTVLQARMRAWMRISGAAKRRNAAQTPQTAEPATAAQAGPTNSATVNIRTPQRAPRTPPNGATVAVRRPKPAVVTAEDATVDFSGPPQPAPRNPKVEHPVSGAFRVDDGTGSSLPRRLLGGRYKLLDPIGEGGFGAVYRALHVGLETEIAVKVLSAQLIRSATELERFRREGVAAARLHHHNAVNIFDFGVEDDGVAYLAMELLDGEDLEARLRKKSVMNVREVSRWVRPVCDVLTHAHSCGVVHRDIKPSNVFFHHPPGQSREVVKVLDFGIARLEDDATRDGLTEAGTVVGTPYFMAPEALLGQECKGPSDVYSLGVMVYIALTGRHPFVDGSRRPQAIELATAHLTRTPAPISAWVSGIPSAVDEILSQMLDKDPDDRLLPDEAAAMLECVQYIGAVAY